jgi:glycerophosphoryl diester phosphodiesterase
MPDPSKLVAHRGFAGHHPENTLEALRAAVALGVQMVELDVQLAGDTTPVMLHDTTLERTHGSDHNIFDLEASDLKGVESLEQVVSWLVEEQEVTAFIELKNESIEHHGLTLCVKRVAALCAPAIDRCVFISFNAAACGLAKAAGFKQIGWVLPSYDSISEKVLQGLNPEYVFCDKDFLPEGEGTLWKGDWEWVIYEVGTKDCALSLMKRGVQLIETKQPHDLLD